MISLPASLVTQSLRYTQNSSIPQHPTDPPLSFGLSPQFHQFSTWQPERCFLRLQLSHVKPLAQNHPRPSHTTRNKSIALRRPTSLSLIGTSPLLLYPLPKAHSALALVHKRCIPRDLCTGCSRTGHSYTHLHTCSPPSLPSHLCSVSPLLTTDVNSTLLIPAVSWDLPPSLPLHSPQHSLVYMCSNTDLSFSLLCPGTRIVPGTELDNHSMF